MFKRLLAGLSVIGATAFANPNAGSQHIVNPDPTATVDASSNMGGQLNHKNANPSAVGSRQGSNQIFGEQKMTGKPGQVYYTQDQVSHGPNNSVQGGSRAGSNQVFGEPKMTGKAGKSYYKDDSNLSDGPNKPTQGSRVGSNQVFGEPAMTSKPAPQPSAASQ